MQPECRGSGGNVAVNHKLSSITFFDRKLLDLTISAEKKGDA